MSNSSVVLSEILTSKQLRSSPLMKSLLVFLVEASLHAPPLPLTLKDILNFIKDHRDLAVAPSSVRVYMSRLRTLLQNYYKSEGFNDQWIIALPVGSYCVEIKRRIVPESKVAREKLPRIAILPCWDLSINARHSENCLLLTQELIFLTCSSKIVDVICLDGILSESVADELSYVNQLIDQVDFTLHMAFEIQKKEMYVTVKLRDVYRKTYIYAFRFEQSIRLNLQTLAKKIAASIVNPSGIIDRYLRTSYDARLVQTALHKYFQYQDEPTSNQHLVVRNALHESIANDPSNATTWACLAKVCVDEFIFRFNHNEINPLKRALFFAKKSLQLEPDCIDGLYAVSLVYYCLGEQDLFDEICSIFLKHKTFRSDLLAKMGALIAYSGDWDAGLKLIDEALHFNISAPGWYSLPKVMWKIRCGDYDMAARILATINMEGFFLISLIRTIIFVGQGNKSKVSESLAELLEECPDFGSYGSNMIKTYFSDVVLHALFFDALSKSGLKF